MGFYFDAQIVKDRLDGLFGIAHEKTDFIHRLHAAHEHRASEWKEFGPILMHRVDDKTKLIRFEFDNKFDTSPDDHDKKLNERLNYIERFLASMVDPGEEYHLTVEERPHVTDPENPKLITYFLRGVIVPKGTFSTTDFTVRP